MLSQVPEGLPTFHWFTIKTDVERDDLRHDVTALSFRDLQNLVKDRIGKLLALQRRVHDSIEAAVGPASYSCAGYRWGLPEMVWETESLVYRCHPDDVGSLSITVEHHTNDYPEIKAAAEGHWTQFSSSSPRFGFVAWDPEDPRIPVEARRKHRERLMGERRQLELEFLRTMNS